MTNQFKSKFYLNDTPISSGNFATHRNKKELISRTDWNDGLIEGKTAKVEIYESGQMHTQNLLTTIEFELTDGKPNNKNGKTYTKQIDGKTLTVWANYSEGFYGTFSASVCLVDKRTRQSKAPETDLQACLL